MSEWVGRVPLNDINLGGHDLVQNILTFVEKETEELIIMAEKKTRISRKKAQVLLKKDLKTVGPGVRKQTTWQQAMEEFLFWKKAQGLSPTTLKGYSNHISHFHNRFSNVWGNEGQLKYAIMKHMADTIMPATYNLRLIYLRAFYDWCRKEGFLNENPLNDYKKRKADPRIVDIPTDTLQKLLSLANQKTFAGLRDYALVLFTLDTGVRPSEAFQLKVTNFDLNHFSVTIPAEIAKTRQARTLPILHHTVEIVKKLIRVRPDDWEDNLPVFCNSEGEALNRKKWSTRMEYYSKELKFKIRPYDLRHAFAMMYLRNGGNAFSLQKMLGHQNLDMTKRYLNITGQDLWEAHQQASPVHNLIPKKKSRARMI